MSVTNAPFLSPVILNDEYDEDENGCTNLPKFSIGKVNGVDNHGNCVELFVLPDCQGDSIQLHGGHSRQATNLTLGNFAGLAKSISQCDKTLPLSCARLEASIQKFSLSSNSSFSHETPTFIDIEMKTATSYRNMGKGTITKKYRAQKDIRELIEIQRPRGMALLNKVGVADNLILELNNFPIYASSKVSAALNKAYSYESWPSSRVSEAFLTQKMTGFEVTEDIEMMPCTKHTVTSYVKFIQRSSAEYVLQGILRGKMGVHKMTSAELQQEVGGYAGIEYVQDFDAQAIIVRSRGQVLYDLGVETEVEGYGTLIEGCLD